jgi:transcriptional regulator GlxA family with amidase domain
MLREDNVKLEPVAMETGLGNAKNLCLLFKEHLGLTPGQWKESFHGRRAGAA